MQAPRTSLAPLPADPKLERLRQEYVALKQQLFALDFVCQGSVLSRRTMCGQQACRCRTDESARHGPYWELTYKIRGKSVAHRLQQADAPLYVEAAVAYKKLKSIVARMVKLSRLALEREGLARIEAAGTSRGPDKPLRRAARQAR